jgi:glycosyltransferase involved in cell wall biosynthesis
MDRRTTWCQVLVSKRVGGGEKLAFAINDALNSRELGSSQLLVPAASETGQRARIDGLHFQEYPLDALMGDNRLQALGANFDIWRKLRRSRPRVLHLHSPFVYGAIRPLLGITSVKTVVHIHLDYTEQELEWALRRPPDLMVLCARFMRDRVATLLSRGGHGHTQLAVVTNAVDLQRFAPRDRKTAKLHFGIAPERPVLLMTANLAPHKGQETAIRAVARLRDAGVNPLLWLVGEEREPARYQQRLQALIAELDLGANVQLLGYRSDVPELLGAADALLLPSVQEGLPLSILEAQAAKVVVLAAPTAGIPEVIQHGRTGFLIDARDAAAYADTLLQLIANPAMAGDIAAAACEQVRATASMEEYFRNLFAAYNLLLSDRT